jgi:hypothetical protein
MDMFSSSGEARETPTLSGPLEIANLILLNHPYPSPYTLSVLNYLVNYPCKKPRRAIGFWDIEAPHFLDNRLTYGGEVVSLILCPATLYS